MWIKETVNALAACVVSFALCAVAYPAAVWGLGQLFFPEQAEGSLVYAPDGKVIGSELIAQPFASDGYFQPRPSAAGANGYAADAASGSNLGTKNPALRQRIALDSARQVQRHSGDAALKALLDRLDAEQADLKAKGEIAEKTKADTEAIAKLEEQVAATLSQALAAASKRGEDKDDLVPTDLVTTSGGGLDPHISPASAYYQAGRVAAARRLSVAQVRALIEQHTERTGAIIGAPSRVNVLRLNRALDKEVPAPIAAPTPAAEAGEAQEVVALRSQIAGIGGQLDRLHAQIEATRGGGETAAGLKQVEARLEVLTQQTARATALGGQLDRIDERVRGAGEALEQLRSELDETRASIKAHASAQPAEGRRP